MEERFEIKPYGAKYMCDNCKEGEMIPTGKMLMTNPPKWEHKCYRCDTVVHLNDKYRTIRWEEVK